MTDDLFTAAREARDAAIARAGDNADDAWWDAALEVVAGLAERCATLHPDDVREAVQRDVGAPDDWRRMGPLLLAACKKGWLTMTAMRRMSERPTNHGHERRIYRSNLYEPHTMEARNRESKARTLLWALTDAQTLAGMDPDWWATLATHAAINPPSDATVARVVEMVERRAA